ncbi:MAG: DEAD/DEAH box helicase [Thalassotalea sp.]|nr:DEAD/DEAH box helicase [Thalassotalea sp.]
MAPQTYELTQSLHTGFVDETSASYNLMQPEILVNNSNKKILTTIKAQLRQCDEFWFSVAFVTTSGVATLIQDLKELETKGVKGKILVSQYLNFTQPDALKRLLQFTNIELKIAVNSDFHAKGYLFSKGQFHNLIIGSSNLTANALTANKEWNLQVSAKEDSKIANRAFEEFSHEFKQATVVTENFISQYIEIYESQKSLSKQLSVKNELITKKELKPNTMQVEALQNIQELRTAGKSKALLISATGTGKTYLSAFDAQKLAPKRLLFIVHRTNIAEAAMKTFQSIFGEEKSYGLYSGNSVDKDKDFIFSTVQTISKESHLKKFNKDDFDYIVIDETHRAAAKSYLTVMEYFEPLFMLGMTATPERTDGLDVFELFEHNIAYEIRLQKALEMKILCPFHYYGITDLTVDGSCIDELADFNVLVSDQRIKHILRQIDFYGTDSNQIRGLVFCSSIQECIRLAKEFNERGFKSASLTGKNSEAERKQAIKRLESFDKKDKIDFIFSVDIFNEGVDIPSVNLVLMLRPTDSAIIFVQQLGRGLRKAEDKDYLTVIDFIGNYKNNFLVPIALYGDTSYNKDTLRKLMYGGTNLIPGASTINFDTIARDRIYAAIDAANLQTKKDLTKDYKLLEYKIGYAPMMLDFIEHGVRDPFSYVKYSKSYFNFVASINKDLLEFLPKKLIKYLECFSIEINNVKRVEESLMLKILIDNSSLNIAEFKSLILERYGYVISDETIESCINNLNFRFVKENHNKKLIAVGEIYDFNVAEINSDQIYLNSEFKKYLKNTHFSKYLTDCTNYAIATYDKLFEEANFVDGFLLYKKYSRKDVFRILNWSDNPLAQNVGGYIISKDKSNCPIFVNYHKSEDISDTTKYEDKFINETEFHWMSKSKRTLNSPDVKAIAEYKLGLRLPLFIKKSNDEGTEFYYMGDVEPVEDGFNQTTMQTGASKNVSVVEVLFNMKIPVQSDMYSYLIEK